MLLEAMAEPYMSNAEAYPLRIGDATPAVVSFAPMWPPLLHDLQKCVDRGFIAARFHQTLVEALLLTTQQLAEGYRIETVALSGGVFQNRIVLDGVGARLERCGFRVLRHRYVPANDGGLALGQAAVAAAMFSE